MKLAAIILAAGNSSRLGQPKQLLELGAETLLQKTVRSIQPSLQGPCVVVLGAYADEVKAKLSSFNGLSLSVNNAWEEGMGGSIACGVRALIDEDFSHVLISVCDQPALDEGVIQKLAAEAEACPDCIIVSEYSADFGPPVIFPLRYLEKLLGLRGDRGAKSVIVSAGEEPRRVLFAAGAMDVDVPGDLDNLLS